MQFSCLRLSVEHASLRNNGIFKPNPYVELSIDSKSIRKTEIVKHTYLPKWNEDFTVLVTPVSEIVFRVLDRSSFLKDSLLGERVVQLGQILEHYNGRLENLELNMDLLGAMKPDGRSKSGELVVVLNGLKIDSAVTNGVSGGAATSVIPIPNNCAGAESVTASPPAAANNSRSSILSGGIRARMRLRSAPTNSSTTSNHSASGDIAFFGPQTMADLRNARLVPSERRHNEYTEQRTSSNMIPVASSCAANPNRTNNSNWEQSQALVPCSNGVSPIQRNFMVNLDYPMVETL